MIDLYAISNTPQFTPRHPRVAALRSGLCAIIAVVIAVAAPRVHGHEYTRELRDLLGADFADARIVALRNGHDIMMVELETLRRHRLGTFEPRGRFDGLSRPYWSPDGKQVVYSYGYKCYVQDADGSDRRHILRSIPLVHEPRFWKDPTTDHLCVVYMDQHSKNTLARGKHGNTMLADLQTMETRKLFDIPCDSGPSPDGTHLGESYRDAAIIDLTTERVHNPDKGQQTCNASLSPDNTYRLMYLYLPHTRFGVKDKYGKELWRIDNPEGSEEWQSPRWSNHPDFCCAVAKYGDNYKMVVIQMSTRKMVVLHDLGGSWQAPQLWLKSGSKVSPSQPIAAAETMCEDQAQARLEKAAKMDNIKTARATYLQIVNELPGTPAAARADEILNSDAFNRELQAYEIMEQVWGLVDRLHPVVDSNQSFKDPRFRNRNQALLVRIIHLIARLRAEFGDTKTHALGAEIAARYDLPEDTALSPSDRMILTGTIRAVSRVPTLEQIRPYRNVVTFIRYAVDRVIEGEYNRQHIIVAHWGMRDAIMTPAAHWTPGLRQRLTVDHFDAHPELDRITKATGADDVTLTPYWALETRLLDAN